MIKSIISISVLCLAALFFLIFMKGYQYISYSLFFFAGLVAVFTYCPETFKKITAVITAVGFIYFCIVEIPIIKNRKTDTDCERKYIVVLGAAVHEYQPSLSLIHRLEAAYNYLITYPDSVAVVSGGQGNGEMISEAQCMENYLTERGIDKERIIQENKSTSTMENLVFSKEIILRCGGSLDDVAILSSPYHLYRAKEMAKSVGYVSPAGVACVYGYPVYSVGMFIREAFGVTHMWVLGD